MLAECFYFSFTDLSTAVKESPSDKLWQWSSKNYLPIHNVEPTTI